MPIDMRTRVTKLLIKESFLSLLKTTPLNKITVTEICHKAEINRVTFYKYYMDVFDLYEKTLNDTISKSVESMLEKYRTTNLQGAIFAVFQDVHSHADEYAALFSDKVDSYHLSKCFGLCISNISNMEDIAISNIPNEERLLLKTYISYGGYGVLSDWVLRGMKESPETIANNLYNIMARIIKSYE